MIKILCQLVGIWQPASLSQISMQRQLRAGSNAEAIYLLETSTEEPARGQTAGPLTKAVLAACAMSVLAHPSQPGSALGDV